MIRVGIDLVSVEDVAGSVSRFGARYLNRCYTAREVADCSTNGVISPTRLAARFAAKEATLKMLAPLADAPSWREIELQTGPGGVPQLLLYGRAQRLARQRGLHRPAVSLTHEAGVAAAVVVGARSGHRGR